MNIPHGSGLTNFLTGWIKDSPHRRSIKLAQIALWCEISSCRRQPGVWQGPIFDPQTSTVLMIDISLHDTL
ncbi:MAG: hypothetical protein IPF93_11285 [Saprospiraceae bacterium]|nr:hypothetical protein [Saprospiraceae bacterium]